MNEEVLDLLGFENDQQFYKMVADVDISISDRMAKFLRWKDEDGSMSGLKLLLLNEER